MSESTLFSIAVICFLFSFLGHVISAAAGRNSFKIGSRIATLLGVICSSAGLILRWRASGHPPLSNMYESLVTLATFTVWVSLLFSFRSEKEFRSDSPLGFFEGAINVFAVLTFGVASLFPNEIRPLVPALQSYWLHIHVALAFIGEACFAASFILSYLLIFRNFLLNRKNPKFPYSLSEKVISFLIVYGIPTGLFALLLMIFSKMLQNSTLSYASVYLLVFGLFPVGTVCIMLFLSLYVLRGAVGEYIERLAPSEERMDELIYRAIAIGFPLFTVGALVFGMVWANKAWGRYWGWDPKETWALITFLTYSIYLHLRLTRGWSGNWMAILSVLGFLVTLFTLFGVNLYLSGLHSYAGN
ncbi:MAG: c-type cytochrome biogenesis protein CcsB [Candidatus Riflebacteria bacterium]|nr:c-type cytochrome biogenesis protein CcsB [Candidatus Riflebacteria bacterium]